MAVPFSRVMDGAAKYIDEFVIPGMNDWQEIAARIAIGRVFNNRDALRNYIINNGYIRSFALVDDEGNVDIDQLAADIKREIERKGKLDVDLKIFGKMRFSADDVDKLHHMIAEGYRYENH